MENFQPEVKLVAPTCIKSSSVKALTTQRSPSEMQHKICATASVPLDSIETDEFRFLSLPLELRRMIYGHYFYTPIPICESRYRLVEADKDCNIYWLTKCNTDLLAVNHQVHDEARDVLHANTIWHFSFNSFTTDSLMSVMAHKNVSQAFLLGFRSRLEFQFIQHVTVGVMFLTVMKRCYRTLENRNRLRVNRKLLKKICETLHQAPSLRTLNVLWHDRIHIGDWEMKKDCLRGLDSLPEKVKCTVFLGREAMLLHSPEIWSNRILSVQEQAVKANLNRYLATVRQQYQASSHCESPDRSKKTSSKRAIKNPAV